MAAAIRTVLADSQSVVLGKNAAARTLGFGLDPTVRKTEEIYRRLLEKEGGGEARREAAEEILAKVSEEGAVTNQAGSVTTSGDGVTK